MDGVVRFGTKGRKTIISTCSLFVLLMVGNFITIVNNFQLSYFFLGKKVTKTQGEKKASIRIPYAHPAFSPGQRTR